MAGTPRDSVIRQFNQLKRTSKVPATAWFLTEADKAAPAAYWLRLRELPGGEYLELANTMLLWLAWTGTATIDRAFSLITHLLSNAQRGRMVDATRKNQIFCAIYKEWFNSELAKVV